MGDTAKDAVGDTAKNVAGDKAEELRRFLDGLDPEDCGKYNP